MSSLFFRSVIIFLSSAVAVLGMDWVVLFRVDSFFSISDKFFSNNCNSCFVVGAFVSVQWLKRLYRYNHVPGELVYQAAGCKVFW